MLWPFEQLLKRQFFYVCMNGLHRSKLRENAVVATVVIHHESHRHEEQVRGGAAVGVAYTPNGGGYVAVVYNMSRFLELNPCTPLLLWFASCC